MMRNLLARKIAQHRDRLGWSQEKLSDHLCDAEWHLSRSEVSKIEGGSIHIRDYQIYYFAEVFDLQITDLMPPRIKGQRVHDTILRYIDQGRSRSEAILDQFHPEDFSLQSKDSKLWIPVQKPT